MKKILVTLLCIVLFAVLAIFLINAKDEPLHPEIQALLDWKVTPVDSNAYPMLLGFSAPIDQDPKTFAEQLMKAYEAGEDISTRNNPSIQDSDNILCQEADQNCYASYTTQQQAVTQLIANNQIWLQRYLQLIQYKNYQQLLTPSVNIPIIQFTNLRDSQKVLLAKISLDPINMSNILRQDIAFWRMILGSETGIITKMLAVHACKSSYSLLAYTLTQHPELRPTFQQELVVLNKTEKSLDYSLENEFISMAKALLELQYQPDQQLFTTTSAGLFDALFDKTINSRLSMHFFYKKNATVNQLYSDHLRILEAAQQGSKAMKKLFFYEFNDPNLKEWTVLYNPLGKMVLNIALANFSRSLEKLESLDALTKEMISEAN